MTSSCLQHISATIYRMLWFVAHAIASLVLFIGDHISAVVGSVLSVLNGAQTVTLAKLPSHVALSLNEDTVYFEDLVQIVIWCQQLNITYLSIFKSDGFLVANKHIFEEVFALKSKLKSDHSIQNGFNKALNGVKKRFLMLNNVRIRLLTSDDSRQHLANGLKYVRNNGRLVDQNDISRYLKNNYDFPDPEVLISFGGAPCLYGFPPWQIRLTEVFFLPTHYKIKFKQFYQILIKFSKCDQRFGK